MIQTLYSQIKDFHRTCRKVASQSDVAKVKAQCLTTLIGEIDCKVKGKGLEVNDDIVLDIVRKFIKDINLTVSKLDPISDERSLIKLFMEKELLESYLPQQLTQEVLEGFIKLVIALEEEPTIGIVMQALNTDYKGCYDGKLAKEIILREL